MKHTLLYYLFQFNAEKIQPISLFSEAIWHFCMNDFSHIYFIRRKWCVKLPRLCNNGNGFQLTKIKLSYLCSGLLKV